MNKVRSRCNLNSRNVTMKWTQRNINRMVRWFDVQCEYNGQFTSRIGTGYKMTMDHGRFVAFVFTIPQDRRCHERRDQI